MFVSSAEVKNGWSYTSIFPYAFISCKRTTLPFVCPWSGQLVATSDSMCLIGNEHTSYFVK
jgi:hypothetical protein